MMWNNAKQRKGFTTVEILLIIIIFIGVAFGVAFGMYGFTQAQANAREQRRIELANIERQFNERMDSEKELARQRLEQVRREREIQEQSIFLLTKALEDQRRQDQVNSALQEQQAILALQEHQVKLAQEQIRLEQAKLEMQEQIRLEQVRLAQARQAQAQPTQVRDVIVVNRPTPTPRPLYVQQPVYHVQPRVYHVQQPRQTSINIGVRNGRVGGSLRLNI